MDISWNPMLSRTKEQSKLSAYRSGKSFDNQVFYGLYLCFINISWRFDVFRPITRVSIRGVKSLGGHFAYLCRGFDFYEVKKKKKKSIFQKENGNTLTLLIIILGKSIQKEQIA